GVLLQAAILPTRGGPQQTRRPVEPIQAWHLHLGAVAAEFSLVRIPPPPAPRRPNKRDRINDEKAEELSTRDAERARLRLVIPRDISPTEEVMTEALDDSDDLQSIGAR